MRVSDEPVHHPKGRRTTFIAFAALAVAIIIIVLGQALAGFYVNFLWFHASGVGDVWSAIVETKFLLGLIFVAVAFGLLFISLTIVDNVVPRVLFMAPDSEFVRRYQAAVGPHARLLRAALALLVALAVGTSASGQWQHWLLFEHAVPFTGANSVDPVFGRNDSFFVFRLPFLSFLSDWMLVALIVTFVVTVIVYFLNGAIRLQGSPRVEPRAVAHLSTILGLMALERAWAFYFVDRYALDLSTNGVVAGASYTDVHVRLPAMTLLAIVSLVSFVLLVLNAYQRTLSLPAIAVGLWILLALVLGVVYPALVQAVRVTPAQSTLELPYIKRNIVATQHAYNIDAVNAKQFPVNQDLTPAVLNRYEQSLDDTDIWDTTSAAATFQKLQYVRGYYSISDLNVDRYLIDGKLTPVVIAVRSLNSAGLPSQSWVNTHLQYTHGYGAVVAYANRATSAGEPQFVVGSIPATASDPSLKLTNPDVYFAPGDTNYVIVDTKQAEVDYPTESGNVETKTGSPGGVPLSSFVSRLAFSIELRDFNLLVSNLITDHSRIIYIPDVRTMVQKALPFLKVDANPYPVITDGHIDWVVDGYTTTSYYPYSEPAVTSELPAGSGLGGSYNYVRDAVKVVVNADTGKMSFYALDGSDPILRSYESAFPGLFKPLTDMPASLRAHLRYPQDMLSIQAQMYGRYRLSPSDASTFYSLSQAWNISRTSTSVDGSPSNSFPVNSSGQVDRFEPVYELIQLPGQSSPNFNLIEPLVPYSSNDAVQTLAGLLVADSSPNDYGQLESFAVPTALTVDGPNLVNSAINANSTISGQITLRDSHGSTVLLGTVMVLPIADSLLYVRPLYVSSSQSALPILEDVIVVYGNEIEMEPTLAAALDAVFGTSFEGASSASSAKAPKTSTESPAVQGLITEALGDFNAAQSALKSGDLGTYQSDVTKAGQLLTESANDNAATAPVAKKPAPSSKKPTSSAKPTTSKETNGTTPA